MQHNAVTASAQSDYIPDHDLCRAKRPKPSPSDVAGADVETDVGLTGHFQQVLRVFACLASSFTGLTRTTVCIFAGLGGSSLFGFTGPDFRASSSGSGLASVANSTLSGEIASAEANWDYQCQIAEAGERDTFRLPNVWGNIKWVQALKEANANTQGVLHKPIIVCRRRKALSRSRVSSSRSSPAPR